MPIVTLIKENVTKKIEASTVKELYKKLNLNQTTVLAARNNELVILSTKLRPSDKITIIPIISGG